MCENKGFKGIREVLNGWKIVNRHVKVGSLFCMPGGHTETPSILSVGEMASVLWRGSLVTKTCSGDCSLWGHTLNMSTQGPAVWVVRDYYWIHPSNQL